MTSAGHRVSDALYLEDLAVGQRFTSRTHTLDAAQIKAFAKDFDPQPFHLDENAAQATFFAGLAASGWHTAAVTMRLVVETLLARRDAPGGRLDEGESPGANKKT